MIISMVMGDMSGTIKSLEGLGAEITDAKQLEGYITDYRSYIRTLDMQALMKAAKQRTQTLIDTSSTRPELPIVLPPRISRILRTFSLLEGTCKMIDPGFGYYDTVFTVSSSHQFFDNDFVMYKSMRDLDSAFEWLIGKM